MIWMKLSIGASHIQGLDKQDQFIRDNWLFENKEKKVTFATAVGINEIIDEIISQFYMD
jgi:hypothetical protein